MRIIVIVWVAAVIFIATGWVMNIMSIFHTAEANITGVFILRCIGVFVFPVGGILGWL
jgi:hypothetical protein